MSGTNPVITDIDEIKTTLNVGDFDTITDEELSSAKARIRANNIYKFDSVFYQAMQVGMLETKDMSWKLLDDYYKISESISLDEIKSAGKTYITGNEPLVTILRPKK